MIKRLRQHWRAILISALLLAGAWAVFWPVLSAQFIKLDDGFYVVHNGRVAQGLSWSNIGWAFGTTYQANWHPLTWISHMLDVQLFGLKPGWHHFTNLVLHSINTLLLFFLLQQLTGAAWRSAAVAALFALHPLRVESVAWVAERKDVLSALFFFLTLFAYAKHVKQSRTMPGPARAGRLWHSTWYRVALGLFALGLMCKPMVVTLPCILLLMDIWPLRRLDVGATMSSSNPASWSVATSSAGKFFRSLLWFEKVPFFALAAISSVVTISAASGGERSLSLPLGARLANAIASYLKYLGDMVWPTNLAVFYPHPATRFPFSTQWPLWEVLAGAALLVGVSWLAVRLVKAAPWFVTGWFWYLVMLLPVIGLLQVGGQAMADRYTYLPLIGIFICLVWGAAALISESRVGQVALSSTAVIAITGFGVATGHQTRYWQDNATLFEHTLAVTRDNAVAFYNLGRSLEDQERPLPAMTFFRAALAADPGYVPAYEDLGVMLEQRGHTNEAVTLYRRAVQRAPLAGQIHNHLATLLWRAGRAQDAIDEYWQAIRAKPDDADAHFNLGTCLAAVGQWDQAVAQFNAVVRLRPADADALNSLGEALVYQGHPALAEQRFREAVAADPANAEGHEHLAVLAAQRSDFDEALEHFGQAVKLRPEWPEALNGYAYVLATHPDMQRRNASDAVRIAEKACALSGSNSPRYFGTLDTAYAAAGRFSDAIRAAQRARELAIRGGQTNMAEAASARIAAYQLQQAKR